ncbi:MAG TPA: malonic semialdehyde reductase [Steroidobacteraceae bacterium]|nr:malonic semialdehyde reductase [Steroidobacteraceae bacterium]HRX87912.1 malonic semialdehyde reductase [Steroidobacteraceae bacterium]
MSASPDQRLSDEVRAARDAAAALHTTVPALPRPARELLWLEARSFNGWLDQPVSDQQLHELYALLRMGPTATNSSPARFVFVRSMAGKERLRPALAAGNVHKVMSAPVIAIIAHDLAFHQHLSRLFPHRDSSAAFAGKPELIATTAFRNGTLQGAYLMLAARTLGLDCGPMSGFDNAAVDREFFAGTEIRSNFLCALGRGDPDSIFQRLPRFEFADVCELV